MEDRGEYILYCFGETKGEKGVGFLIKKQHQVKITDFSGINERVAVLRVQIEGNTYSIIQVYAPTTEAKDSEITNFYQCLQSAIEESDENIILMGDMNAKIGQTSENISYTLGKYGYGIRNERGELFIDFCQQNKLTIMNTVYNKPDKLRWTWESPNGVTRNVIDFITTNLPKSIENFSVLSNFKFPSDHRMLRMTLNITCEKQSRRQYSQKAAKHVDIAKFKSSQRWEDDIAKVCRKGMEYPRKR